MIAIGIHVFTTTSEDAARLKRSLVTRPFLVVGFCAAWCNTCGEFRHGFEQVAEGRPDATFVWLDIEDDAALAGDIDVEDFPTIAVFHERRLLHFGVSLPRSGVLSRLLGALSTTSDTIAGEPAVADLARRLEAVVSVAD